MTKPLADGDVVTRTYCDLEAVSDQNMDKLMLALIDLKDGGGTETAFNILLGLYKDEAQRIRIMTYLRLKHVNDAAASAEQLAASNRTVFDKQAKR